MRDAILPSDLRRLLASAPKGWRELYRFLALTGCRKGEALALTWEQIERQPDRIVVRIQPHDLPDGSRWQPKTTNGTRGIVLPVDSVPNPHGLPFVFLPRLKRPIHPQTVKRALDRHCKAAGIPQCGTHAFRRMRITQALMAGAEPVALSRAVGHRSLVTTLEYLRDLPVLCELPDIDAEPVPNPTAAAWAQSLVSKKRTKDSQISG